MDVLFIMFSFFLWTVAVLVFALWVMKGEIEDEQDK
jgi:hypothetical protein